MKNIIYTCLFSAFIISCASDNDAPGTEENQAPSEVSSLIYPTNNLLCITNVLDFQWSSSTDPNGDSVSYVLEISRDNQFSSIDQSFTVSETTKTVTLEKGVAFYWRVKATDSKNLSSDYSIVSQFYTEGIGEINHLPFSPELLSPQLNTTVTAATTNLTWNAEDVDDDTLTYDVYFGTTNPPTTKVGDNQSAKILNVDLSAATSYYWKVVVKDDKGGATIGQIWGFDTN